MSGAAVMTADVALAAACSRLALLAGAALRPVGPHEPAGERLLLLGPDALPASPQPGASVSAPHSAPPPSTGQERLLVCAEEPDRDLLLRALAAGVAAVAVLPRDEDRVVEALIRSRLGVGAGRLVAVVGASGGVGASTLSVALARAGRNALAVDLDGAGPGLDALVGCEGEPGPRWSALAEARGAVSAEALRAVLPRHGGAWLLSCDGEQPPGPAVAAVVAAWCADGGDCVVDLPRWLLPGLPGVSRVVVLTAADVPGVIAARRLLDRLPQGWEDVVVARRAGAGLTTAELAAAAGRSAVGVPWRSRLTSRSAAGLPAPPDRALVRFAAGLLP